jgi:glycosidase
MNLLDVSYVPHRDPGSALDEGWQRRPTMQVFVRSYFDSDGDGFGDLAGLVAKLDYLHGLGVRNLLLMPVTESADRMHGYGVTGYRSIEPAYGGFAEFERLITEAHRRGMGVLVDYVINHCASRHPIFQAASADRDSEYRDWFLWRDEQPPDWRILTTNPWRASTHGFFFATFGDDLPDFNFRCPEVIEFHSNNLRFWLNLGVDGFRFDAIPHLIKNGPDAWMDQPEGRCLAKFFSTLVRSYERRHIICEAAIHPVEYAADEVCGGAFAFHLNHAIMRAVSGSVRAAHEVAAYCRGAPAGLAIMLSNHDRFAGRRPWDRLQGDESRYRLAAATYLLMPGTPVLYYGEEIGMGAFDEVRGDLQLRGPMSWTADPATAGFSTAKPYLPVAANVGACNVERQAAAPDSLHAYYRRLLAFRNATPALQSGTYDEPTVYANVLLFQRTLGHESLLVAINFDDEAMLVDAERLPGDGTLQRVFPARADAIDVDASGVATFRVGPRSVSVYRVERETVPA